MKIPTAKLRFSHIVLALIGVAALMSFTYSNKEGGEIPTDSEQMRILSYHGHRYVCYRYYHHSNYNFWGDRGRAGTSGASIVHDPDCPCHKRGGEK